MLGIAVLVAVLGTPQTYAQAEDAFAAGWWVCAAAGLVGALAALRMTPRRPAVEVEDPSALLGGRI